MALEHSFRLPLLNGLHARPASHLAEIASTYRATVTFVNDRTARTGNAKSVLALVGTDSGFNDPCRLVIDGIDGAIALAHLRSFVLDAFARCDGPLVVEAVSAGATIIPRALRAAGLGSFHAGIPACRGLGAGRLIFARGFKLPPLPPPGRGHDATRELARFQAAVTDLRVDYMPAVAVARGTAAGVLQAHAGLLNDPELFDKVAFHIGQGQTAAQAVVTAIDGLAQLLAAADSLYLRERVLDLEDIGSGLLGKLCGPGFRPSTPAIAEPSILVAERLTPAQFLALDVRNLRGLILGHAGQTSHTVILARSLNIPTLTAVPQLHAVRSAEREAILDANLGILISDVTDGVRRYYERESAKLAELEQRQASSRMLPAVTTDGRSLEVAANIVSAPEAAAAFAQGADSIGLFRTELLFSERAQEPDEEEQYAVYAAVVRAAVGRPVIIRTLDVGGDKPVSYLPLPAETNPFLGYRGVRLYSEHAPLARTQLRALWRAAAHGPIKVLIPMIASIEEARFVRTLFNEARADLESAGVECGQDVKLGFMLEVPSVAYCLDELCATADFFSIGTNDLAQYFFAADRENDKVAGRYGPLHPAFLRLLRQLVEGARAHDRWIGLCGELAENPAALPLLVGLGLDEISLSAPRIAATKVALAQLNAAHCTTLLHRVLRHATRAEALKEAASANGHAAPMLTPALVLHDLAAATKEEAIHSMIGALHVAGRTDNPAAVEEAIWRREDSFSTGFGDGFAIPHCKTDDITTNSIAVARLREPVAWQSLDGQPTDVVILLVVRAGCDTRDHMRSLSRLSRLLTQNEFRSAIRSQSPAQLTAFLLGAVAGDAAPRGFIARRGSIHPAEMSRRSCATASGGGESSA